MPDKIQLPNVFDYLRDDGEVRDEYWDELKKVWDYLNHVRYFPSRIYASSFGYGKSWGKFAYRNVLGDPDPDGQLGITVSNSLVRSSRLYLPLYVDVLDYYPDKTVKPDIEYLPYQEEYRKKRLNYSGKLRHFFDQPTQYKDIYFTLLENKPKSKKSVYAAIGRNYAGESHQSWDNPVFGFSRGGTSLIGKTYIGNKFLEEMQQYFWSTYDVIWDVELYKDNWITVGSHESPPAKNVYWKWGLEDPNDKSDDWYQSNESSSQFGYGINNMHYSFRRPHHRLPWKYWEQYGGTTVGVWEAEQIQQGFSDYPVTGYGLYGTYHPQVETFVVVELRDEDQQYSGAIGDQGIAYWTGHKNKLSKVPFADPGLRDSIGTTNLSRLEKFYSGLPNENVSDLVRSKKLVPLEVYNILELTDTRVKIFRSLFGMHVYKLNEERTSVSVSDINLSWVWDDPDNPPDSIVIKRLSRHPGGPAWESDKQYYHEWWDGHFGTPYGTGTVSTLDDPLVFTDPDGGPLQYVYRNQYSGGWRGGIFSYFDHVPWEQIVGSNARFSHLVETVYSGLPNRESDGSVKVKLTPELTTDADGNTVTEGSSYGSGPGGTELNVYAYYCIATRNGKTYNPEEFLLKRRQIRIRHLEINWSTLRGVNLSYPSPFRRTSFTPGPEFTDIWNGWNDELDIPEPEFSLPVRRKDGFIYFKPSRGYVGGYVGGPDYVNEDGTLWYPDFPSDYPQVYDETTDQYFSWTVFYGENPTISPFKDRTLTKYTNGDVVNSFGRHVPDPNIESDVREVEKDENGSPKIKRVNGWNLGISGTSRSRTMFKVEYDYSGNPRNNSNMSRPFFGEGGYDEAEDKYNWRNWLQPSWRTGGGIIQTPDYWKGGDGHLPIGWSDRMDTIMELVKYEDDLRLEGYGNNDTGVIDIASELRWLWGLNMYSVQYGYEGEPIYTWDWNEANVTTEFDGKKTSLSARGQMTALNKGHMSDYDEDRGKDQFPVAKILDEVPPHNRRGGSGEYIEYVPIYEYDFELSGAPYFGVKLVGMEKYEDVFEGEPPLATIGAGSRAGGIYGARWVNSHGNVIGNGAEELMSHNLADHSPSYRMYLNDPLYDPRDISKKKYNVTDEEVKLAREYQNLRYLTYYLCPVHQFGQTAYPAS